MPFPQASNLPHWQQKMWFVLDPLGYLDRGLQQSCDIVNVPVMGDRETLFVSHPQALKQIFTRDTKQLFAPRNDLFRPVVGNYSLLYLEGDRHLRERKLLLPPFHGDRIHQYGQLICQLTEQILSQIAVGSQFTARYLMQAISLEVIFKAVFGLSAGERFERLKRLIARLTDIFKSPFTSGALFVPILQKSWGGLSPWHQFLQLKQQINELIVAEIGHRREGELGDRRDILSLLLSVTDETGRSLDDLELRDQLFTLLLAGHETTATAIAWALYWIHRHPEVKETLRQELETVDIVDGAAKPIALFRLPYLSAVCAETLRIYPVSILTTPREVKEPFTLLGCELQPGTRVYGSIYGLHRREDLYPNPLEFRPERFLGNHFTSYEFIPFGGGVRRCLGEALALWEMKLAIATMMSQYELKLADNRPEIPQTRGVTLAPARGVKMVMQGKRN